VNERLNEQFLQAMGTEQLADYTTSLEQQMGRTATFLAQVREEWNRRNKDEQRDLLTKLEA